MATDPFNATNEEEQKKRKKTKGDLDSKFMAIALLCFLIGFGTADLANTPEELILGWGYPCETHEVFTEDGYILNVQRIPRIGAPAVYLQHGLLDSSGTWLVNLPNQSLGFILFDAGFDVWLGNQRGNRFSNRENSSTYNWYFSIDEMARYDDEALLKYITSTTTRSQIAWIGHSRGTQQMFYGLSSYPEHAKYINVFLALGPAAYLGNVTTLLLHQLASIDYNDFIDKLGVHDFLPTVGDVGDLCIFCKVCCADIIGAIVGPGQHNSTLFNQSRYDLYTRFAPAGTSSMEMAHYAQLVKTGTLHFYDFGKENPQHYGTPTPPVYNLSNIGYSVPIALFSGGKDLLADPTDVAHLASVLGTRVVLHHVDPDFNHMAFTWSILSAERIYIPYILPLLKKYNW